MERDKIIFFRNLFSAHVCGRNCHCSLLLGGDAGFLACRRRLGDASFQRGRERRSWKHHPDLLHQCADCRSFLLPRPRDRAALDVEEILKLQQTHAGIAGVDKLPDGWPVPPGRWIDLVQFRACCLEHSTVDVARSAQVQLYPRSSESTHP